jgi:hypothetical protein
MPPEAVFKKPLSNLLPLKLISLVYLSPNLVFKKQMILEWSLTDRWSAGTIDVEGESTRICSHREFVVTG